MVPNLLNREWSATESNRTWVAESTAIWTAQGWLFLAVVLDIFSPMVVDCTMDAHRDEALVEQTARLASLHRHMEPDCSHHCHCISQEMAGDDRHLLTPSDIVVRRSSKGDCSDTTRMEHFSGTRTIACADRQSFVSRTHTPLVIFEDRKPFAADRESGIPQQAWSVLSRVSKTRPESPPLLSPHIKVRDQESTR